MPIDEKTNIAAAIEDALDLAHHDFEDNVGSEALGAEYAAHSEIFERKFRIAHREIELIRGKIHEKKGLLFFKTHIYTKEELANSSHHQRIYSVTKKIGDDARQWQARGKLSAATQRAYGEHRDTLEAALHEINLEIARREPTWWERTKGAFEGFVVWVMQNLPTLKSVFLLAGKVLSQIPYIGPVAGRLAVSMDLAAQRITHARK